MKLIKGDMPGDIKLDVSEDEQAHDLFKGLNPMLAEVDLTVNYDRTIDGYYRLTKPELECEFRRTTPFAEVGVTTRHVLTMEQLSAILDIIATTDARITNIQHEF